MGDTTAILLGISALAQLGCLARVALVAMVSHDAHQLSSVLYANFFGCFAIGAVNAMKEYLDQKGMTPLFYGINAGFCGALTTFSTWMFEVARWCIWWPNPTMQTIGGHWWGQRALSASSAILAELGVSCLGFQLGSTLLKSFDGFGSKSLTSQSPLPVATGNPAGSQSDLPVRRMTSCQYTHGEGADELQDLDGAPKHQFGFASILCVCTTCTLTLALFGKDPSFLFIMILGPLGALLRYYLGVWYNNLSKSFRWGTFAANFLACIILAAVAVVNVSNECFVGRRWIAGLMKGLGFGFCGSLSTMSSFVAQLYEMDELRAALYCIGSISACLSIFSGFLGTYLAMGGTDPVCA